LHQIDPIMTGTKSGVRRAGLSMPLFSCCSSASWGIGDIGDLAPVTRWLSGAGLRVLQLLPLNEMAPGEQSPYSAISAMAIDPIYIRVPDVPEFAALGGEPALSPADRDALSAVRRSARLDHATVRRLKRSALRAAFEWFVDVEWRRNTARALSFRGYLAEQAWWIEDYSLFRALHAREDEHPWTAWPIELQRREPSAIDRARRELAHDVLFFQYLQWLASEQWRRARLQASGVALFGDLPFMVDGDSADVWARQHQFRLDASVGAPPDAFSADGQNWGMPLYRWDAIVREDFHWLRERARRTADLYDGYRIDHLVGFYRTYARPVDGGDGFFTPADEPEQRALGERVLQVFRGAGAEILAEDLGTVPDFVRASLARLGVPGFRVFRWERQWLVDGHPFRDPAEYPHVSVATSGTHDTETSLVWWDELTAEVKREVGALPTIRRVSDGVDLGAAAYDPTVRDALLEALFASGSDLLLLPVQDVFGWRDRINQPATVSPENWTFRLPWPVDRLAEIPEARERQHQLRTWGERHRRA
jgi:4-alpha-glucanotransferase